MSSYEWGALVVQTPVMTKNDGEPPHLYVLVLWCRQYSTYTPLWMALTQIALLPLPQEHAISALALTPIFDSCPSQDLIPMFQTPCRTPVSMIGTLNLAASIRLEQQEAMIRCVSAEQWPKLEGSAFDSVAVV
jgi:hypothetical protein